MINYDTIISNFDDKVTLYNWLRKVEEALKNASATSFVVNKKGNATLSFSITFADGETLESGDIVLQQGESVDQARIASGILQLHLTNGTWLTAGNVKPVSNFSIDANQHLIVNYQDGTSQDLGAIFNGNVNITGTLNATKVTGDEIIENDLGVTFETMDNPEGTTLTINYAGCVKNGNKITFAIAGIFNKGTSSATSFYLGKFNNIPAELGAKLIPNSTGFIDNKAVAFMTSGYNGKFQESAVGKAGNRTIYFISYNITNLAQNTDYTFRYEATFLLSDNLAQ